MHAIMLYTSPIVRVRTYLHATEAPLGYCAPYIPKDGALLGALT